MGINGGQTYFNQVRTQTRGFSEMCFWLLLHLFLSASDVREGRTEVKRVTNIQKPLPRRPENLRFIVEKIVFHNTILFLAPWKALLLRELLN